MDTFSSRNRSNAKSPHNEKLEKKMDIRRFARLDKKLDIRKFAELDKKLDSRQLVKMDKKMDI